MWDNQHSEKNECSIFIPIIGPLKSSFDTVRIRPLQDGGIWFPDIVPINLSQAVIRAFKTAKIEYGSFPILTQLFNMTDSSVYISVNLT